MADERWPALRRWSMLYRGSPRVDEALDLLRENDYDALLARTSKLIAGRLTWARVAAVAVGQLARGFLLGEADRAASYAEDARALADRLRERDAHPTARVTAHAMSCLTSHPSPVLSLCPRRRRRSAPALYCSFLIPRLVRLLES